MAEPTTEETQPTTGVEMTDERWEELENSLSRFKNQKLRIDGYEVAIRLEHISKLELGIAVFVNGKIDYKWTKEDSDSDIPEKFWWKRSRRVHSKKAWKSLKKVYTAAEIRENGFKEKVNYYAPYFKSFRTLKRTLKRNNESIKWLKTDN